MGDETSGPPAIGIVGVGNVGAALGERLAKSGYRVRLGAREGNDLDALVAQCEGRAEVTSVAEAGRADVVFVAVPSAALLDVAAQIGDREGRIVVDCTNPVGPGLTLAAPPEGSNAARLARALPRSRVVKAFNGFGAEFHRDPRVGDTVADVLMAGDDGDAKRTVREIAERAGFRALDAGGLGSAGLVEASALLWIHFAMRGGTGRGGMGRGVVWKLLDRG